MIRSLIVQGTAAAIGKIGATELRAVLEHHGADGAARERVRQWVLDELYVVSGVFPPTPDTLLAFAEYFLAIVGRMDLLVAWFRPGERAVLERHCPNARLISMEGLDPFYVDDPWTAALAGKTVLVASPFVDSIHRQYQRRELIWPGRPALAPAFDLQLMRLPFSAGLVKSPFDDWFRARDALIAELRARSFEVLLVGGGAFSFPLAVAAKEIGRIGIHLGGSTQILFGIWGARWEGHPAIAKFHNENWVRPSAQETPEGHRRAEAGSYW